MIPFAHKLLTKGIFHTHTFMHGESEEKDFQTTDEEVSMKVEANVGKRLQNCARENGYQLIDILFRI